MGDVRFHGRDDLCWPPADAEEQDPLGAVYHVYRLIPGASPPDDGWQCYLSALAGAATGIYDEPGPGEIWWFQVTSESTFFGQGSMGLTSLCVERQAATLCGE